MVKISLTTFLDFTAATAAGRLTQVRKARKIEETGYNPAADFWRPLRTGIQEEFEEGWEGKDSLARLRKVSTDDKKQERYAECVKGLSKFAKNKAFGKSARKAAQWTHEDLSVSVNPELILEIDGETYVVKLYFRQEKLAKLRVDTVLYLLKDRFKKLKPAILDVPRGTLITETVPKEDLDIVLEGDAAHFLALWNRLEEAES